MDMSETILTVGSVYGYAGHHHMQFEVNGPDSMLRIEQVLFISFHELVKLTFAEV
jgi:hypothetical protein